jgi:hypothetical protein
MSGPVFPLPDVLLPFFAPPVLPFLVGVSHFRVPMQETPQRPPDARKDERQKEQAHDEERNLGNDRQQDTDHSQHEEKPRPKEILRAVTAITR